MPKRGKNYRKSAKGFDTEKLYSITEGVSILKKLTTVKFDESVDVAVRLGVDTRHADQMVRGAIRRQSHLQPREWEAHDFLTGAEALAFMDDHPTDVVMTDLNMSPMDGEAVLQAVQERFPGTVRLMLTGAAGMKLSLQAALLAHQVARSPFHS